MPLTDTAIKNTKATDKPLKLFDGGGLFLLVMPKGGRWWRLKYRFGGKEKLLSLGTYPDVPLAGHKDKKTGTWIEGAREKREHARKLIKQGIDPGAVRKSEKRAAAAAGQNTFEAVARKWHAGHKHLWKTKTAEGKMARLEADVFPALATRPIHEITKADLRAIIDAIKDRGSFEVARRTRTLLTQIFTQALDDELIARNPADGLRRSVAPPKPKHHSAITAPKEIGALMRAIQGYAGEPITCAALKLAPLVFVRPGELRAAEWAEFDLERAEWRIPGRRMKMGVEHIVPLSRQALAILRDLQKHSGRYALVFPGVRSKSRPLSENTLGAALRRLGYTPEQMTAHGFRSMASTRLNEMGWHRDAIERQLAHVERNAVRAAYNSAEHLEERRRMMQAWADYLDGLAAGADVVPMRASMKN